MSEKARPMRVFLGRNVTEAELCVAYLESSGIDAEVENPHTHSVLSGVEKFLDQEAGIGVIVSSDDAEAAAAAVEAFRTSRPLPEEEDEGDGYDDVGGEGGEEE